MRFSLENWSAEYIPSLAESADDARIGQYLAPIFPYPYTRTDAKRFVDAVLNDVRDVYRAIVCEGRAVGCVSLVRLKDEKSHAFSLGYWLTPSLWGQGIVTRAVREICRFAFETTGVFRIQAEVFAENAASHRVLQKCGFVQEGVLRGGVQKDGAYFDTFVYALLKSDASQK